MKLGIFYNKRQADEATALRLASIAQAMGGEAAVFSEVSQIGNVDRLLVLGGDGTVLRAAKRASESGIPLVGVNYGNLGFLTEFERGEEEEAVTLALSDCPVLSRSLLEADLDGTRYYCLNELALLHPVTETSESRIAKISVAIDGSNAGDFSADGLIVTTPTGSTAYSLSAGGCIMTPDSSTFMLTPVCSFSMRSRPIVFSDRCVLTFDFARDPLLLYGDGVFLGKANSMSKLTVRKAERSARFLSRDKNGYFRRLTEKINH